MGDEGELAAAKAAAYLAEKQAGGGEDEVIFIDPSSTKELLHNLQNVQICHQLRFSGINRQLIGAFCEFQIILYIINRLKKDLTYSISPYWRNS